MPPVFGPRSLSKIRLWSCADANGSARTPSQKRKKDTSGPDRHSSTTRRSPAAPNRRSLIAATTAASALAWSSAITTPLPAARPSAFRTTGKPYSADRTTARPSSTDSQIRKRAVGTACLAMNALANALLDSSRAADWLGPNSGRPAAMNRSATPRLRGSSGPTTVRSARSRVASSRRAPESVRSAATVRQIAAIPGFPGAHNTSLPPRSAQQPGDERVLSRPAAENENSHDLRGLPRRQGMHDGGDYFVDVEVDCA